VCEKFSLPESTVRWNHARLRELGLVSGGSLTDLGKLVVRLLDGRRDVGRRPYSKSKKEVKGMKSMKLRPPKGMRDFLPEEKRIREEVVKKIKRVFELYGFEPAETPALEYAEFLEGKYGEEEKLIYKFQDRGGRWLALRYDLTAPLARVVASNPQLPLPFKRYAIDKVWRYDNPQRGRYREFYQCDVDIVGSRSMMADAEVVACAFRALKELGFESVVRINNRKLMNYIMEKIGVERPLEAFRAMDKLDKIGKKGVEGELKKRGIKKVREVIELLEVRDLKEVERKFGESEGSKELRELFDYLDECGVKYVFDISLVRGLDYYTGPVFEISSEFGSIAGGGRYDGLIGAFSGRDIPATGISLGLERIIEVMKKEGMIKDPGVKAKVFVAEVNQKERALRIAEKLRDEGINTEVNLMERSLGKQLEYADKRGIRCVVIVGKREKVTVRDMESGKEEEVAEEKVTFKIKELLR